MPILNVSEKKIDSKISVGERTAVVENIKYPHFDVESEKYKKLCDKMNSFYAKIAEKYSSYARIGLVKKIRKNMRLCKLPMCLSMKYAVSECGEKIVSVVLDLSFSEGKRIKMRRFSQMWHLDKLDIILLRDVLKLDIKNKKMLWEKVVEKAFTEINKGNKEYFDDAEQRVRKHFCFNNSFITPKGVAFFFDSGTLRPEKYGACCFVVPFRTVRDIINPVYFDLPQDSDGDL